ncbi:Translation initiation factor 6 [uncultured archaeon]|nr:Translation initiation factor 6 [uncultured archaeon]
MPISKTSNFGNPYIGLFARSSDRLAAVDISASPKFLHALCALEVPVVKATFGGSGFAGIFLAMNSNGAVLPSFCSREEIALFKSHGLNVATVSAEVSAAGNNIAANDFGAIANPDVPRGKLKEISDCLGVEVHPMMVAGYATVGSAVLATNKGFVAHNRASEEELKQLHSIFRVEGVNSTLCTGTAFVSLCALANSKSALFGESCTGFEMGRAVDALAILQ